MTTPVSFQPRTTTEDERLAWLDVAGAAAELAVHPSTVYALCAAGLMAHYRVGRGRGRIRTTKADCLAYLASCRTEANERPHAPLPVVPPKPQVCGRLDGLPLRHFLITKPASTHRKK